MRYSGKNQSRLLACSLALFGLFACTSIAGAQTTITFDSLSSPSYQNVNGTPGYTEGGFTLSTTSPQFASWGTNDSGYAGSAALFNNYDSGITVLSKNGGGLFSLNSIDLAEVFYGTNQSVIVTFTGHKSDLSTISQAFTLDGSNTFWTSGISGFQTFAFSGFDNLTSVDWAQTPNYNQFDNIVLDGGPSAVTPEGDSLLLVSSGLLPLAGLGLWHRGRQRRKA